MWVLPVSNECFYSKVCQFVRAAYMEAMMDVFFLCISQELVNISDIIFFHIFVFFGRQTVL